MKNKDIYIENIDCYRSKIIQLINNESKSIVTFYNPVSKETSMLISFNHSYGCRLNGWSEIIENSIKVKSYQEFILIMKIE